MTDGNGLPTGWELRRIDELGTVQLGRQRSPGKRSDKFPTKYLRAANVTWNGLALDDVLDMDFTPTERETFRLRSGDILLSEASGSASEVGKPALWNDELELCCFQNTLIRFRPKALTPRYALHLFSHLARSGIFVKASRGVGIHHIGAQRFSALDVPVPPQAEQERIADRVEECLSDLAAGVAALERMRKKLKRYRSAVLHAAVTGRLTEAWRQEHGPPAESGEELLARLLIEHRRQWEERTLADYEVKGTTPPKNWRQRYQEPVEPKTDDLPELPEGWCWASVGHVAEVQGGLQKSPARAPVAHHYPYLRVANVLRGRLDLTELHRFELTKSELAKLRLQNGDLLIVEGNGSASEIGRSAIWDGEVADCVHQNHIIRCRFVSAAIPRFIDAFVNSPLGQSYMRTVASSTSGLHTLSVGKVRSLVLPLPSVDEQESALESLQEKLSQIDAMEAEVQRGLARAARLRQAILKAAFAGQLVSQDTQDEPASALLERIRSEREAMAGKSNGRPKRSPRKKGAPKKTASAAKKTTTKKKARKS